MQRHFNTPFANFAARFCGSDSLFFDSRLSKDRIHQACHAINHSFRDRVFSPAVTIWMFVGQTLSPDHSCQDALSRFNVWRIAQGKRPSQSGTTSYCEARQRIPEQLPLELARSVGRDCVSAADPKWLWKGRHVKLVDGTTVTMADTLENQNEYPQSKSQAPGVGFPMARLVVIISLAVGSVLEVAIGKYAGKLTGETSLLRTLLSSILPGEIVLADRYYASYWLIVSAWDSGFDLVARAHHLRKVDFRKGLRLGYLDQLVVYHKPDRPAWMSKQEYQDQPEFILVRHLRYQVTQKGFRTREIVVATTLVDAELYTAEEIAELYRRRWTVEIDIRSIKTHLQMDHLRCKSPSMVRKEIYCHLLAYNLARSVIVESALAYKKNPHQLSFKGAVQAINAFNSAVAAGGCNLEAQYDNMIDTIAQNEVGDRPDRVEPRELKRRPKQYKLMKTPRSKARNRAA